MIDIEEIEDKNKEFLDKYREIKDQQSEVEIVLYDNKHGKAAHNKLTYRELMLISAILKIKWEDKK